MSTFKHVWIPIIIAIAIPLISIIYDLQVEATKNLFQRSGAFMIVAGAYIAFYENKNASGIDENGPFLDPDLWYKWPAVVLGFFGTVICAYGDLIIEL